MSACVLEVLLLCHIATAVGGHILEFHLLCETNGYASYKQTEKQTAHKVLLQRRCRVSRVILQVKGYSLRLFQKKKDVFLL